MRIDMHNDTHAKIVVGSVVALVVIIVGSLIWWVGGLVVDKLDEWKTERNQVTWTYIKPLGKLLDVRGGRYATLIMENNSLWQVSSATGLNLKSEYHYWKFTGGEYSDVGRICPFDEAGVQTKDTSTCANVYY